MRQLHVLMTFPPEWSIVSYPTNNCWAQAFSLCSLSLSLSIPPFLSKMLYILDPCTKTMTYQQLLVGCYMSNRKIFLFGCSMRKLGSY